MKSGFAFCCLSIAFVVASIGCSEGILWRTGHLSPWAKQKWAEEEQIATTLFARKQQMTDAVEAAKAGGQSQRDQMATQLKETIFRDPIVLIRLHATRLLGELDCPTSLEALKAASQDANSEIRIAAVQSLAGQAPEAAVNALQEVLGSDTNVDVRIAATKSLGNVPGNQSVRALSMALEDNNPALQVAATESLASITGNDFGPDVFAWREFIGGNASSSPPTQVANEDASLSGGSFRR